MGGGTNESLERIIPSSSSSRLDYNYIFLVTSHFSSAEGLVPSPLIFKEDGIIKIGNVGDGLLVSILHSKKIAFHGMRRLINSTGEALKGRRVTRGSSHGTIIQGGSCKTG